LYPITGNFPYVSDAATVPLTAGVVFMTKLAEKDIAFVVDER